MFKNVDPKQNFPQLEQELLDYWKENKIFERSISERPAEQAYVFYDGPPFATGLPHYGHILAGTLKDVIPRYWTMRGHRVERRFGWDCHGLPVENLVEKELGVQGRNEIESKIGISKFNEACRSSVLKYTAEWEKTVERMGRWVDFKNDYKTMDPNYMESIWWVFKELWNKDLIYQGHKPMHVCPNCVTPLSNFEVSLGYVDITDTAATVKFALSADLVNLLKSQNPNFSDKIAEFKDKIDILAWTTTPWTLPGNVALAFGKDISYSLVEGSDQNDQAGLFIVATDLAEKVFASQSAEKNYQELGLVDLNQLVNLENEKADYQALFPYYAAESGLKFKLITADFVTTEEGTGVVHIAPMFGEDDFQAGEDNNLIKIQHVAMDGSFNQEVSDFAGKDAKKQDPNIVKLLNEKGLLFKSEKYKHSYPHCWRCDTPLLNYATSSWFVSVEKIKSKMLQANEQIHWVPEHLKYGRFGKWLENARDWAISRNRFWGAPLPIWVSEDQKDFICIGSIAELQELSGQKVSDLHKHFVDEIVIEKNGQKYYRTPEVLDCWFESGAMPYAQNHYPFENKEWFDNNFPAQFIAEGLDQTRGWFYTLVVLGAALFDKAPFKNVVVNGMILAEDGKKMSKRLKNYPDPQKVFDEYGADALRFYMMNSPVVKAETLRLSEKGINEVVRNIILPLWNSYSFFVTYANIDNWTPDKFTEKFENRLDRWVVSELEQLLQKLTNELDAYNLQQASEPIANFIDSLTNWYIRRSRRRFWKSENDQDKNSAYSALYFVLTRLSLIIAPFMPFVSEEIYRNLTGKDSVHLEMWPEFDSEKIDLALNREIELVQNIVSIGLALRAQHKLKVRQPLAGIEVVGARLLNQITPEECCGEQAHCMTNEDIQMIKEELNIKAITFLEDSAGIAAKIAKPIGAKIGPKYGSEVQAIIQAAKEGRFTEEENGIIKVADKWLLNSDEYEISYEGKSGHFVGAAKGVVISLDGTLTDELKQEGLARDLIRQIQQLRKDLDFNVEDHISLKISADSDITNCIQSFQEYIQSETLCDQIEFSDKPDSKHKINLEDSTVGIEIERV